jgi:hypothetical protein
LSQRREERAIPSHDATFTCHHRRELEE